MIRTLFLVVVLPKIYVDVACKLRSLSPASSWVADIWMPIEREDRRDGLIATVIGHADRLAVRHLSSDPFNTYPEIIPKFPATPLNIPPSLIKSKSNPRRYTLLHVCGTTGSLNPQRRGTCLD